MPVFGYVKHKICLLSYYLFLFFCTLYYYYMQIILIFWYKLLGCFIEICVHFWLWRFRHQQYCVFWDKSISFAVIEYFCWRRILASPSSTDRYIVDTIVEYSSCFSEPSLLKTIYDFFLYRRCHQYTFSYIPINTWESPQHQQQQPFSLSFVPWF